MCGISGFTFNDRDLIQKTVDQLGHRGPDARGVFLDEYISLGHTLLSITETPKKGQQPFISDDGDYVLVYNGEIYNYLELRDRLKLKGFVFKTTSDTEVLLDGLIDQGLDFLDSVNGMFAFAFYDKRRGKLFLSRDHMGRKPLYYVFLNNNLYFASEISTLLIIPTIERRLDFLSLKVFFELGYLPGQKTLLQGVQKLAPGECLTFDFKNRSLKKNWLTDWAYRSKHIRFNGEEFRALMGQAVMNHTMGLRPFGMYLSGGLDSATVLLELRTHHIDQVTTFTMRFDVKDQKINEDADLARRLSKDFNTLHKELIVDEQQFVKAIPATIRAVEEPRYHPSIAAYYLMAQFVSQDIVVNLTGDGGDEMFMGYEHFYESRRMGERWPQWLINMRYSLRHTQQHRGTFSYLTMNDPITRWWYLNRVTVKANSQSYKFHWNINEILDYLHSIGGPSVTGLSGDRENNLAFLDRYFWLAEDSFIISDKLGMQFGVEARFPYVDRRIVEYASKISSQEKLMAPGTKGLIRQAYKNILPDYILHKKKSGWTAPVSFWLQNSNSLLGNYIHDVLSDDYYTPTKNLFDFDFVKRNFLDNALSNKKLFFPMFYFQIWAREFNISI